MGLLRNMADRPDLNTISTDGAKQISGDEVITTNIAAAQSVVDSVQTTLGPNGLYKAIITDSQEIIVTRDGGTVVQEIPIEHPGAEFVALAIKNFVNEFGDGATSTIALVGALLRNAESLLADGFHPMTVINGYGTAIDEIESKMIDLAQSPSDGKLLVAKSAISQLRDETMKNSLAAMAVDAVDTIHSQGNVDLEMLNVRSLAGGSRFDSTLINGIVVDKDRPVHPEMPLSIEKATIGLVVSDLTRKDVSINTEFLVDSPKQLEELRAFEQSSANELAQKVINSGVDVLFCLHGINDRIQRELNDAGILAFRRVKFSDRDRLEEATGAQRVSDVEDLTSNTLGYAEQVELRSFGDERLLILDGCDEPKSTTVILRGGPNYSVEELERLFKDAVRSVKQYTSNPNLVPGGGATEVALSNHLQSIAKSVDRRNQLAIDGFAEALLVIPWILATNAGQDPIKKIAEIRTSHEDGNECAGINESGEIVDNILAYGIADPMGIRTQSMATAYDVTSKLLRIDNIVIADPDEEESIDTS